MARPPIGLLADTRTRVLVVATASHEKNSGLVSYHAVENSARELLRVMRERGGLDERRECLLIDPDRATFLETLAAEARSARTSGGVLLFYFIGHGLASRGRRLHLATTETRWPANDIDETSVAYAEVSEILSRSGPATTVIVLDCCNSSVANRHMPPAVVDPFSDTVQPGRYLLTAAGYNESARISDDETHTAFTGALISLFDRGNRSQPADLTLDSCYRYLRRTLPDRGCPVPRRYAVDMVGELPLLPNTDPSRPAVWAAAPPAPDAACPYPGLSAFRAEDERYFFGRENLIRKLRQAVAGRQRAGGGPLVLVGPSGVGKSSVLRAGLIPALRRHKRPGLVRRPVLELAPGPDPLGSLARRLALASNGDQQEVIAKIGKRPEHAAVLVREVIAEAGRNLDAPPDGIVMIVDQFEELFAPSVDDTKARAFVQALCAMAETRTVQGGETPLAVMVLALRADFLGHCTAFPQLLDSLESPLIVPPLKGKELRQVIVRPARVAGLGIGPGLVDRLLQDLRSGRELDDSQGYERDPAMGFDAGGVLPLLSHALQETWRRREDLVLTLAGYQDSGGIWQAVRKSADEVFEELADVPGAQETARRLLLSMVQLGTAADDTRRSIDLRSQDYADISVATVKLVVARLAAVRLITLADGSATLTHEAVLRSWPRLRRWIEEDRAGLLVRQQVLDATEAWLRDAQSPDHLFRGLRLENARQWAADPRHGVMLSADGHRFLVVSRRREAAALRTARRSRRRIRGLVCAVLISLTVFGGFVFRQQRIDAHGRDVAISQRAALNASALKSSNVPVGLQLALAAYQIDKNTDTRSALLSTYASTTAVPVPTPGQDVGAAQLSPDGALLAVGITITWAEPKVVRQTPAVQLWDVRDRHHPRLLPLRLVGPTLLVKHVAFSPDGHTLAASVYNGGVWVWPITGARSGTVRGRALPQPPALGTDEDGFNALAFDQTARSLAVVRGNGTVWLWHLGKNAADPPQPLTSPGPQPMAHIFLEFAPGTSTLVGLRRNGSVTRWNLRTPGRPIQGHTPLIPAAIQVTALTFDTTGHMLITGGHDGSIRRWRLTADGRAIPKGEPYLGHVGSIAALAVGDGNRSLASAGADETVRIWEFSSGQTRTVLPTSYVDELSYSSSGSTLITKGGDVHLWDMPGPVMDVHPEGGVLATAFAPDGRTLTTAAENGQIQFWHVQDSHHVAPLGPPLKMKPDRAQDTVRALAFSDDGKLLAAGGNDFAVHLWDVTDTAHPRRIAVTLTGPTNYITSLHFAPRSRLLLVTSATSEASLWDLRNPAQPIRLGGMRSADPQDPYNEVLQGAIAPRGRLVALGTLRGLFLWDIRDPRHPKRLGDRVPGSAPPPQKFNFSEPVFSPDGRSLAASGAIGPHSSTVLVWDVQNPRQPVVRTELTGPTKAISSVAFNRAGTLLAGGGVDHSVWLWSMRPGAPSRPYAQLKGHSGGILTIAFGAGDVLASGGDDTAALLWETDVAAVTRQVCDVSGGRDTLGESTWSLYLPERDYHPPCV